MTSNLAAVLEAPKARLTLKNRPIPTPGPGELLVRNHAIAANPVDWKIQEYELFLSKYPTVLGSDVCGIVSAVGPSVTRFKVGDRVTGFSAVVYNSEIDHGAWQTYTILRELATTKIPDSMSFEEGSVFPMAFATAADGIFVNLEIPRPPQALPEASTSALLVWGASSSVGSAVVQIARAIGLKVLATASPSNHAFVKSLGAIEVFDYHDPKVVSNIHDYGKKTGLTVTYVYDSISENGSLKLASDVLTGVPGSKMNTVLPWPADDPKPEGVDISHTFAARLGQDYSELGAWFFNEWLEHAMASGAVVPAPKIQIVEGGIAATQKVFDMLKSGVSATKLVVSVE